MGIKNYHCLLLIFLFTDVRAFSIWSASYRSSVATRWSILSKIASTLESESQSSDEAEDDYDVACYIVNEEEIIADGEKPHVVCTSEPEEASLFIYAWFNGIDPKRMIMTEDGIEGVVECKEGESYKGKPEWECT
ncbi:hypothetical protein ACHAWX_000479 [Stephanocyclus meneghinianus]